MRKTKLGEIGIDLDELKTLVGLFKLLIVIILSYFMSGWIHDLITASHGYQAAAAAIIAQIISFFILLYVFYQIVEQFTK